MEKELEAVLIAVEEPMERPALAMAYVPFQQWDCVYETEKGWPKGTIFPCLDKPFLGGACPHGV